MERGGRGQLEWGRRMRVREGGETEKLEERKGRVWGGEGDEK